MKMMLRFLPVVALLTGLLVFSCGKDENNSGSSYSGGEDPEEPIGGGREKVTANGVSFYMISVVGDTFQMGATPEQGDDAWGNEMPVHDVFASNFSIGETEVTQELWQAVMGSNPSYYEDPQYPVESVSWEQCDTFITRLNQITGRHFRFPTEAEWEFAARGGKNSRGYKYAGGNNIDEVGWYWKNSGDHYIDLPDDAWRSDTTYRNHCKEHVVKSLKPNELSLYDMCGNVEEWCYDGYQSEYYQSLPTDAVTINPTGVSYSSKKSKRGGYYGWIARNARISYRIGAFADASSLNAGLRLAE